MRLDFGKIISKFLSILLKSLLTKGGEEALWLNVEPYFVYSKVQSAKELSERMVTL